MFMARIDERSLKNDIYKCLRIYAKAYVNKAMQLTEAKAKKCIDAFYNSYTPKFYVRTYNIKKHSIEKQYHDHGKARIDASLRISTLNLFNNYGDGKTFAVADAVWSHGYHGNKGVGHIMSPSPYNLLWEYYKKRLWHKQAQNVARKAAVSAAYSIIRVR